MCCSLVLSSMQFSVIVGSYVMNFYMRLPRIINNDGFCHSDHSRHNIKLKVESHISHHSHFRNAVYTKVVRSMPRMTSRSFKKTSLIF